MGDGRAVIGTRVRTIKAELRQWCKNCQRATLTVIIEGYMYCSVCEPDGRNWWEDDEDDSDPD